MRVLVANIEEVFREAAARWTLVAYFILSSLFIFVFASAVNLDVVDGALAGAKLFGQSVQSSDMAHGAVKIEDLVSTFEGIFAPILFVVGIFLAIFSTAHLVPRLQEKGTIDLYLSRPVPRIPLLLSRYVAGMALASLNVIYLVTSIWLIVVWKTEVVHFRFLLSGGIILFAIATLLALAFLIGVVTSSTAVSIMGSYGIFFLTMILAAHKQIEAALTNPVWVWMVKSLYWVLPKTFDLQMMVYSFVAQKDLPEKINNGIALPIATTAAFAIGCLALASWLFKKKEF
ncbi:MAG: ABC transporter permease subunit [Thermoanaerobaculia bacterium]|jgi:ABC-type transport system involved in multi-copper enzyme maturation permease subunit